MSHRDGDGDAFSLGEPILTALGHEVIVGHAQKVRLITKSRRKDDRLEIPIKIGMRPSVTPS